MAVGRSVGRSVGRASAGTSPERTCSILKSFQSRLLGELELAGELELELADPPVDLANGLGPVEARVLLKNVELPVPVGLAGGFAGGLYREPPPDPNQVLGVATSSFSKRSPGAASVDPKVTFRTGDNFFLRGFFADFGDRG